MKSQNGVGEIKIKNKNKKDPYTEPRTSNHQTRLNWLRAAVLGAGDGIISTAGLVVGVAGATSSLGVIFAAGIAGIIAGTISMAAGEYVSVSSQKDSEKALLKEERHALRSYPEKELEELAGLYEAKGLQKSTARTVAKELTKHDAFAAHYDAELRIDPNNLTNPLHAASASAVSFLIGATIPFLAILVPPQNVRVPITFISVIIALAITGVFSAKVGGANVNVLRSTLRVIVGGAIAMVVTYSIGQISHVSGV